VSDPTAAVNLAAQLQALDTVFLGLDPIDLMGAAMTDVDRFTEMITGPLRDNVDKYFDLASGQLTQYGKLFSKSFLQIDGINNIFKSEQEFADFLAKASKEGEVRELLMNSAESFASLAQFTPKEQDQLIGILASQYQAGGIVTGLGRKNIGNLTEADMKQLLASGFAPGTDSKQQIEKAAQGAVSVKDQAEVNKKLVDSMSYATDAINEVTTVLSSKEMRSVYSLAGNVIMDAGLKTFESDFFRKFKVFREYMGISTEMGLLYQGYVDLSIEKGENFLAQAMKSFQEKLYLVDPTTSISPTGNGVIFNKNLFKKDTQSKGGIIGVQKLSIPSKSITSTPKSMGSPNSELLSKVLMSFITNKFGPGIVSNMGGGTTKIIVSGEINNMINGKDESVISGDKVLKILEKQLA